MEGHVNSYRDLTVYKKARELAKEIFELSKAFPDEERYSLTSQIRRSSRSVGAQISEAWAKRLYKAHFISKLTDGDGEHQETQHWIDTAHVHPRVVPGNRRRSEVPRGNSRCAQRWSNC